MNSFTFCYITTTNFNVFFGMGKDQPSFKKPARWKGECVINNFHINISKKTHKNRKVCGRNVTNSEKSAGDIYNGTLI